MQKIFQGCIFDFDGVLIDSEEVNIAAIKKTAKALNMPNERILVVAL